MNSENTKTSKPHVLILNLTYKIDLLRGGESASLSNLQQSLTYYLLYIEKHKNLIQQQ